MKTVVVARKGSAESSAFEATKKGLAANPNPNIVLINSTFMIINVVLFVCFTVDLECLVPDITDLEDDVSSTKVRQCLIEGKSIDRYCSPSVAQYLTSHAIKIKKIQS